MTADAITNVDLGPLPDGCHAIVLADTRNLTRQDWLDVRRLGLGGSDAPTVCGENPYSSPYALWLDKTGQTGEKASNEAMDWGNRLEPLVADWFAETEALPTLDYPAVLQHPDRPWMLANVDRFTFDEQGPAILEVKTTGGHMAGEWEDGAIPTRHVLQVQHYLECTGLGRAYVVVLIGGQRTQVRQVERDQQLIDGLVALEERFWRDHVLPCVPPPLDAHPATTDAVRAIEADPDAEPVDLPEDAAHWLQVRANAKAVMDEAKKRCDEAENHLRAWLADHTVGLIDGQPAVTWKPVTTRRLDLDALRADHPDIADRYTRPQVTRRLHIPKGTAA